MEKILLFIVKKGRLVKLLRKQGIKKTDHGDKDCIALAGELLSNAAYFGLIGAGNKKNAVLRGGLLGAAAGTGAAFLSTDDSIDPAENVAKKKVLTIALYTLGGLMAGKAIKEISKKNKKKKKHSRAK